MSVLSNLILTESDVYRLLLLHGLPWLLGTVGLILSFFRSARWIALSMAIAAIVLPVIGELIVLADDDWNLVYYIYRVIKYWNIQLWLIGVPHFLGILTLVMAVYHIRTERNRRQANGTIETLAAGRGCV